MLDQGGWPIVPILEQGVGGPIVPISEQGIRTKRKGGTASSACTLDKRVGGAPLPHLTPEGTASIGRHEEIEFEGVDPDMRFHRC